MEFKEGSRKVRKEFHERYNTSDNRLAGKAKATAIHAPVDVRRDDRPGGAEQFHAGDVLIVAGDPQDLLRMCQAGQAV